MNFIRDIIGEKRRMNDRPHDPAETVVEDRSSDVAGAGASVAGAPDRPAPYRLSDPVTPGDSDAPPPETEADMAPRTDDGATDVFDARAMGSPSRAPLAPSRDRDVYEELRSIFVAGQEDRIGEAGPLEDGPAHDDDPWSDFDRADPAPLREAIQRIGMEYQDVDRPSDRLRAPEPAPEPDVEPIPEPEAAAPPPLRLRREPEPEARPDPESRPALRADPGLRLRPGLRVDPGQGSDDAGARASVPSAPGGAVTRETVPDREAPQAVAVPRPAMGRGSSQNGRAKTRLLGFNIDRDEDADPIAAGKAAQPAAYTRFPLGWLIVIAGPGRGAAFTLFHGVSKIGRGPDQTIPLDFGDNAISRENHAAIAYDQMQNRFYIGHGGKANLVRRNDRPVLATEELSPGDRITIGETVLRFVPLCDETFSWQETEDEMWSHAATL